ncbi:hypothetical protein WJ0W_004463 [Paenibacillus melissococcoides]|uniref:Uncharacterized protein n=1 Tax=Paenibacillus melissococcoides TaxID=2912268 RepID=A0ABN8UCN3_9BACL|nr:MULTISPECIES: hypothetical protein [Paenibacillus]MEB9894066.1 hypothetical protein [Bacillus cereus]CAH8247229.1 hypothetical protein WJ0W_004463 [Paenibacillus melissococcoides]CAH8717088.1 hypothetical protein HTL2_004830 [Paenibacillus melissococcoides]CAH8718076.1 hypothetical protein WDD9_005103 [Paenibacillus melissococcoides]GIO79259.1 hypothetical protein J6TS7_28690 [Paenibacillus dendritiformis]
MTEGRGSAPRSGIPPGRGTGAPRWLIATWTGNGYNDSEFAPARGSGTGTATRIPGRGGTEDDAGR